MNITEKILQMVLLIALFLVAVSILVDNLVPWYTQEIPYKIDSGTYLPGDSVEVSFNRKALVDLKGEVVRELVRIDMDSEVEVERRHYKIEMDKGEKNITTYYTIPTIEAAPYLEGNSYVFKGILTYRPFGLFEKSLHFTTEKFHIEVNKKHIVGELQ